ncbi:MAG TPA: indolepyruvate ferredoxin oxidoreductase family protein [Burkholderiaceae bacterium]
MNAADAHPLDLDYVLDDRYLRAEGRVYLTGTQALVRVLLDQARRDRAAGMNTAGFVSGYRGSPLGSVDLEMWRSADLLREHRIEFLPAVNEDLAATAVLGSQQVETKPGRTVDGVFGLWYGKGPGVDRAGDALKHGNAYGSSPRGGVLVVAGDDHGCVSSSMPHQSDVAFMAWFMPTLNPASVAEYLSFGEYGYALSRFSGMWVGFKAISETVESAASVQLAAPRAFVAPHFEPPPGGLHYRWPDLPGPQIESRIEAKKQAVYAFTEANPIDRRIYDIPDAIYGIVTTGKAHLDTMEALRLLGLDEAACRRLGIDIYKVGMVWPLPRRDALEFVREKREILVVEEKRGIVESQLKEYFYDYPGHKPERMVGKVDEIGQTLIPWIGELSPRLLPGILAQRLDPIFPGLGLVERANALMRHGDVIEIKGATRTPYFCSGCPHNTSTKVPEGSQALAGIGCHFMASWMDRNTTSLIQMGGEGVNWAASSKFTGMGHVFQNLGEGTWYHSGSMAIRQAIAAGANITYKILYNDAVAMTGGQPVDGPVSVAGIAQSARAEGVHRIALVSDAPELYDAEMLPAGTTIHHRRDLDAVQRELRTIAGVTVLIYEQACATEKRRRRKRGALEDPLRFPVINELVCEGCGDCSVQSNCLSVEPLDTPLGRKRRINPSTCNKDFSCLEGFCPSFVTVEGAPRRRSAGVDTDATARAAGLAPPELPEVAPVYDLLVTGVGGTGVITVGALVAMAAHLEGRGVSVLDFTGFAQKFGPVLAHVRLGTSPDALNQVRIDLGAADAVVACDIVVATSPKASSTYRRGTRAVASTSAMPTGDVVRARDADLKVSTRVDALARAVGDANLPAIDANRAAERLLGDSVYANVMMLGFAWQHGLVPIGFEALMRAIELNGVQVERNRQAFAWGRIACADRAFFVQASGGAPPPPDTLDAAIERRAKYLVQYQDQAYAARYRALVDKVRAAERALESTGATPGSEALTSALQDGETLTSAVAQALFRLMAYKDEYEVARLHAHSGFAERLREQFDGEFRVVHHLAPPLLPTGRDALGRPRKRAFGPWMHRAFGVLAPMKRLRGTAFDPFGHTAERRAERALVPWFEGVIARLLHGLDAGNVAARANIARAALEIRGFGPVKAKAMREVRAEVDAALGALGASGLAPPGRQSDESPRPS